MPMYDYSCVDCKKDFDGYRPIGTDITPCPDCGAPSGRVWVTHPPTVIGDECDIIQENGFAHPQRFTSMSDRRRALKEAGMEEMVRHTGVPGTDKSPHTSNWGSIGPGTLENAKAMLERVGAQSPITEDDIDDAVMDGEVTVPVVNSPDGRTIGVRIGRMYTGLINPEDIK